MSAKRTSTGKSPRRASRAVSPAPSAVQQATAHRSIIANVSLQSVVRAAFALLAIAMGLVLVVVLNHVIVLFLLGIFVATVIDPSVRFLQRHGVQPSLGILLHYAAFMALAVYLAFSLIPVLAQQVGQIAILADTQVQKLLTERLVTLPLLTPEMNVRLTVLLRMALRNLALTGPDALQTLSQYLSNITAGSLQFLTGLAGSVFVFVRDTFIVLLAAFFVQLDRDRLYRWFRRFIPKRHWPYLDRKAEDVGVKLGQWMRGQLMLCLTIGIFTFVILVILRMPYALTLSILSAFTEFIPYVGPLIGAVPAVLIAGAHDGPGSALIIASAYYVIQFCENNFIVPLIMKHAVDLSAVAVITAMLVGVSFPSIVHPVLGILISIPLASISGLFLEDLREWQRRRSSTAGV